VQLSGVIGNCLQKPVWPEASAKEPRTGLADLAQVARNARANALAFADQPRSEIDSAFDSKRLIRSYRNDDRRCLV
jgi:hypothetical protein